MSKRLLLLSNSKNHGQEYLEHATDTIRGFLGDAVKTIAFVPYAGVTVPFDAYAGIVREHFEPWGYKIESVHETDTPGKTVETADAVVVGGGNTLHLLKKMYENNLVDLIRARVNDGIPYIGWSAGSNLACPTIRTTNDMPIVEPPSFDAINLIPFQINPHYLDQHPEGHAGETREQRILEFIEANPDMFVAGLREGSMLKLEGSSLELLGDKPMRIFKKGQDTKECHPGDSLAFLIG